MNRTILIDAIVRQTTVLVAQLATSAGSRATLAHVANQVFSDLVRELRNQGVSSKGIADMFGIALRTYHHRVARLGESRSERGVPLWDALLAFLQTRESVPVEAVLTKFCHDDEMIVRGVLRELVDSGLVFRAGKGHQAFYRAARADELPPEEPGRAEGRLANLVWIAIKRFGPIARADLKEHVPASDEELERSVQLLLGDRRISEQSREGAANYRADECVIPVGDDAGWEAAVFDHYQAVVTTVCARLNRGNVPDEWVGGSTYCLEVDRSHPLFAEAVGFLSETRERAVSLRKRIRAWNERHPIREEDTIRVLAYVGQSVLGMEEEGS